MRENTSKRKVILAKKCLIGPNPLERELLNQGPTFQDSKIFVHVDISPTRLSLVARHAQKKFARTHCCIFAPDPRESLVPRQAESDPDKKTQIVPLIR
jgi:hypothetical protein